MAEIYIIVNELLKVKKALQDLIMVLEEPAQKRLYDKMFQNVCLHLGELRKQEIKNGN
jgi:hypothetical protein